MGEKRKSVRIGGGHGRRIYPKNGRHSNHNPAPEIQPIHDRT